MQKHCNGYYKALSMAGSLMATFCCPGTAASPTENEYDACGKLAVALLERCLDEKVHYQNHECWKGSESRYRECVTDVKQSHVPDQRKRDAIRRAEQRRLRDDSTQ